MKLTKYIFIFTLLLCMTAQGSAFARICVGTDHSDSGIEWASDCHSPSGDETGSHEPSFNHKDTDCIDISIVSIAGFRSNLRPNDQFNFAKSIILKPAASNHPFASFDFSLLKTSLTPVFSHKAPLSIESTILII